jgi:hypothetical protein
MTSRLRIDAELARMISFGDGLLGSTGLPTGFAGVPAVVYLDGEELVWSWIGRTGDERSEPRDVDPRGMLDAFLKVEEASTVLGFARRFGVLGICEHGRPASHNPPLAESRDDGLECLPVGYRSGEGLCREPLARWFYYAGLARAMVAVAAELHQGVPGRREDWKAILVGRDSEDKIEPVIERLATSVPYGRLYLGQFVNQWLELGDVRPRLLWTVSSPEPRFLLQAPTFGLLGVQLMVAISRSHELVLCSGCARPYLREGRKAPRGRRNYCGGCGLAAARRDAQRDHRARNSSR